MDNKIIKLVYFDEGSATDFIQISNGGKLTSVMTLFDEDEIDGKAGASAQIGIKAKVFRLLLGLDTSVNAEGAIDASFNSGTVVQSIVSNTVLTDFLNAVQSEGQERNPITKFEKIRIEQIPGSIASISLVTPYLSMLRSGQGIPAGEFDISLDKLDSTISKAKGYLEFLGHPKGSGQIVLRFNRAALKNNYSPSDLLKMDLTLYAVHVGSCKVEDLVADKELSAEGFSVTDNPDYLEDGNDSTATPSEDAPMYDVILAGVSARD